MVWGSACPTSGSGVTGSPHACPEAPSAPPPSAAPPGCIVVPSGVELITSSPQPAAATHSVARRAARRIGRLFLVAILQPLLERVRAAAHRTAPRRRVGLLRVALDDG